MPWKELCTMGVREQFVLKALEPGCNFAALCREYGVSRKTGYKWMKRYEERGLAGLEDASRRPHSSSLQVDVDVAMHVVSIRTKHSTWGARKIVEVLRNEGREEVPSERTVHRILVRAGLLQPGHRPRKRPKKNGPTSPPRAVADKPNDVWTVDFKGWWLGTDRRRVEPLTVRDARTRFVLAVHIVRAPSYDEVRPVFEELFKTYGIPKAILSDNGTPFVASQGKLGLTRLSAWWATLGIEHHRSRVGKPQDNGGHERMHKDIADELEVLGEALTPLQYQEAADRWRHDFNCHRPHEALGMRRPADVYRRSEVAYGGLPASHVYPDGFVVKPVNKRGAVFFHRRICFISNAAAGMEVGLEPIGELRYDVWLAERKLGWIDCGAQANKIHPYMWDEVSPKTA